MAVTRLDGRLMRGRWHMMVTVSSQLLSAAHCIELGRERPALVRTKGRVRQTIHENRDNAWLGEEE